MQEQRLAQPSFVHEVRDLTREDLELLKVPRASQALAFPAKLRDSHHRIARLVAAGLRTKDIAERTGYAQNRISTLCQSPAMQELVARYREKVEESFVDSIDAYYETATNNMLAAERQIADRLDEADAEGETLPMRDLIAISRDAADRFGYGKKATNVNINVDFAAQLERAIARSGKTIDSQAVPIAPATRPQQSAKPVAELGVLAPRTPPVAAEPQAAFRRRA